MTKSDINPWLHLWFQPKKTLRSLLATNPLKWILWLALISGIVSGISLTLMFWIRYPQRSAFQSPLFFISIIVGGAILGLIHLYFGGWIYMLTGSWIGGKGNFTAVKCAVGWSNYLFLIAGILGIISYFVIPHPWLQGVFGFLNFIVAVWGFIIFVNLIGEAHQFSAWKGLLAFLIALVLIFVCMMIIALIIPLLLPLFQ